MMTIGGDKTGASARLGPQLFYYFPLSFLNLSYETFTIDVLFHSFWKTMEKCSLRDKMKFRVQAKQKFSNNNGKTKIRRSML
jgi:hypothetical protein